VDGGIYRHEFVASAVIDNLMRVQMDTAMPLFSAMLTPQHFDADEGHTTFSKEHFIMKGQEVAQACATTLAALSKIG
jgi:6,7-dimethyl-8-ribityllumazine synthase